MRILVLSALYPPNVGGDYERLCFEVTAALAEAGHEMVVLTSRYGGQVADYPAQRILRQLDLLTGATIYDPYAGSPDQRAAVNQSNLRTLRATLDEVKPDAVLAWNLLLLDASLLQALEQSPFRTIVMLTDDWLLVMRDKAFMQRHFHDFVHGGQVFVPPPPLPQVSLSQRLRGLLHRTPPQGLEAIFGASFVRDLYVSGGSVFGHHRVIHKGIKPAGHATVPSIDRTRLVTPGTLRLLFAGQLVDLKGAHTVVEAMDLLDPARLGVDQLELTIVGDTQDTGYMNRLNAAIVASGRAASIQLYPSVPEDQYPALFNAYDIYLFPSLYEPFSLTLIHAMALGIPTIASDIGGNPEILRDGEGGLLFRKGDPAALADAITRMAVDGALRARLAAAGRQAASQFTFERMMRNMTQFLAERR